MSFYLSVAQKGINSPFESLIQSASARYGVSTSLIKAIISQESQWKPDAVNLSDPSYGLMQLNFNYFKTSSGQPILDPEENINRGTAYLAEQTNRFGPEESAIISSYNAGHPISGNLSNYVQPVLQYRDWFVANDNGQTQPPEDTPDWGTDDADLKLVAGIVIFGMLAFALWRR